MYYCEKSILSIPFSSTFAEYFLCGIIVSVHNRNKMNCMKYIIRIYLINTQIRTFLSGKHMIMTCCYNLGVLFSSLKYQMKLECSSRKWRFCLLQVFIENTSMECRILLISNSSFIVLGSESFVAIQATKLFIFNLTFIKHLNVLRVNHVMINHFSHVQFL